jgi:hypothetical protein
MADIDISQVDADDLIDMEKRYVVETDWTFPTAGERLALALTSVDKRENFMLDIVHGSNSPRQPTRTGRGRQSFSCAWISMARHIGIQTAPRFPVRISMFTGKVLVTNGQFRRRAIDIRTCGTCF